MFLRCQTWYLESVRQGMITLPRLDYQILSNMSSIIVNYNCRNMSYLQFNKITSVIEKRGVGSDKYPKMVETRIWILGADLDVVFWICQTEYDCPPMAGWASNGQIFLHTDIVDKYWQILVQAIIAVTLRGGWKGRGCYVNREVLRACSFVLLSSATEECNQHHYTIYRMSDFIQLFIGFWWFLN